MANVLGELFQNIADAIRSKTGSTDTLKPNQFPEAIEGITAGGGEGEKPFDCHSVTFVYGDKSYVRSVADGDTCADPVERGLIPTPTKESTAQYNYTFYGWGASDGGAADANILKNIRADKTVYAVYTATLRMYTITWLDEDGTELPGQKQWAYGTVPSYTPTKDGYAFTGWTPALSTVTGDASYTATWEHKYWDYTLENGVLTICGNAAMDDFTLQGNKPNTPWFDNASEITSIVICDGITHIGDWSFFKCVNATSVSIPNTVETMGRSVFQNCSSLVSCEIPDSVTTIGLALFSNCSKLESFTIPASTTISNTNALFLNCTSLTALTIDFATDIGMRMFEGCTALTSITIPNSVASIGPNAFYNCTALTSITIPNSVASIGDSAFRYCTALTSITIPNSVTSILQYAFLGCSNLTTATFKNTIGWYVTKTEGATSGTTLSSANLANTSTAATYLKTTYSEYHWYNT